MRALRPLSLAAALPLLVATSLARAETAEAAPAAAEAAAEPAEAAAPDGADPASSEELASQLTQPRGERRHLVVAFNPFTLQLERYGGVVEIVPVSHHAIVASLFYAHTETNEDSFHNRFRGVGGEIGYRYYTGHDGPRGFYVSPSLLLGAYDAIPARGEAQSFVNYGAALDVGYQATVADRWVVGLGVGLQYSQPDTTFPQQELPASVYANPGVRPRLLLALGLAF